MGWLFNNGFDDSGLEGAWEEGWICVKFISWNPLGLRRSTHRCVYRSKRRFGVREEISWWELVAARNRLQKATLDKSCIQATMLFSEYNAGTHRRNTRTQHLSVTFSLCPTALLLPIFWFSSSFFLHGVRFSPSFSEFYFCEDADGKNQREIELHAHLELGMIRIKPQTVAFRAVLTAITLGDGRPGDAN